MKKRFPNLQSAWQVLILLIFQSVFAQQFAAVDNTVRNYPKSFASPQKMAEKINADFTTDQDKVRAIFSWIALNVRYDLKAYYNLANSSQKAYSFTSEEDRIAKEQQYRTELAAKALRSKKGICQDYSALFHMLCDLTGIKCMTITGTSKSNPAHIGKLPGLSDHAWNAVKIDNAWRFIDVTWASGVLDSQTQKMVQEFNDAYFFTAPEVFFLNHFPDDERYLMIEKTPQEFAELPLYYGTYLEANYEIAEPENGLFSLKETDKIIFKIIDLPESHKIGYVFSSESRLHEAAVLRRGNVSQFEVPLNKRNRGYLTVYNNGKSIVTYKLLL